MKAVLLKEFGTPEQMYIGQTDRPSIQEDEVLVKIHCTALNRADTLQRMGKYAPPKGESEILGLEMSGTIAELGSKVTRFSVGDRVCALLAGGGYAEYVNVPEALIIPMSNDMSFQEGAAIPEVFLTAYQALYTLINLTDDETILIHAGASGVGTAAIQLAKLITDKIVVTASAAKHQLCKDLGAALCIDYKAKAFKKEVLVYTEAKGVDAILDFVAGPYFQDNVDLLKLDGRMVMLAALGGGNVEDAQIAKIVWKRLRIMGSTLRSRSLKYKIDLTRQLLNQYWSGFDDGSLKPIIDSVYDWQDVVEAHKRMEANLNAGKIILNVV